MAVVKPDPQTRVRRAETLGLLMIALVLLITVLLRWGGALRWWMR